MGDLNTMQEATMMTTLFNVLATLCVTGPKGEKKKKEGKGRKEEGEEKEEEG